MAPMSPANFSRPSTVPRVPPCHFYVGRHVVRRSIGLMLVERHFDERTNNPLVFLQVVLSSHLALLCLCRLGAHAGKLRWPIDSWLPTDDYFFAGGSKWMTYSPDRDDL
jgi:hypothetical protein